MTAHTVTPGPREGIPLPSAFIVECPDHGTYCGARDRRAADLLARERDWCQGCAPRTIEHGDRVWYQADGLHGFGHGTAIDQGDDSYQVVADHGPRHQVWCDADQLEHLELGPISERERRCVDAARAAGDHDQWLPQTADEHRYLAAVLEHARRLRHRDAPLDQTAAYLRAMRGVVGGARADTLAHTARAHG